MPHNDDVDAELVMDERLEAKLAVRRGERVAEFADAVAGRMFGTGRWSRAECLELRREVVAVAIGVWYPGLSVDLPKDPEAPR